MRLSLGSKELLRTTTLPKWGDWDSVPNGRITQMDHNRLAKVELGRPAKNSPTIIVEIEHRVLIDNVPYRRLFVDRYTFAELEQTFATRARKNSYYLLVEGAHSKLAVYKFKGAYYAVRLEFQAPDRRCRAPTEVRRASVGAFQYWACEDSTVSEPDNSVPEVIQASLATIASYFVDRAQAFKDYRPCAEESPSDLDMVLQSEFP